jgi:hypothetical protein
MIQRALHGSSKDAPRYLGRGITVCDRWRSFDAFLADMGERPTGMTIDRIDNAKGYEPGNCRWATPREQALNRRSSTVLRAFGREQHITEWAREFGISHQALKYRIRRGVAIEVALTLPTNRANRLTN